MCHIHLKIIKYGLIFFKINKIIIYFFCSFDMPRLGVALPAKSIFVLKCFDDVIAVK
jgi:hypothetical protein